MDESVAFLLHFLLEPLTQLFAVQVAPEIFLNLPAMWQQFRIFLLDFICALLHVCYCLNWNLLLETFPVLGIEF